MDNEMYNRMKRLFKWSTRRPTNQNAYPINIKREHDSTLIDPKEFDLDDKEIDDTCPE